MIESTEIILFVEDQKRSRRFYETAFGYAPIVDVPGMTEFDLGAGVKLGLMPNSGIAKILTGNLPAPETAVGIPRCELYLRVDDLETYSARIVEAGGRLVSAAAVRDWGDRVTYFADPDGHVIAFARPIEDAPKAVLRETRSNP